MSSWKFSRRAGLKGLVAGGIALTFAGPLAAQQASEGALVEALRSHLRFSAGFRRKLRTGFYSEIGANPTAEEARRALADLTARLAALDGDNLALIHAVDDDGHLRAWLVDQAGLVADGHCPWAYDGLHYLTWSLRVDQRMQTRVAVPRGAEPPAVEPPDRWDLTVAEALDLAATELLGPEIAAALAERSGRLLVLPARDTGSAPYPALPLANGELLTRRHAVVIVPDIETLASQQRVHDVREIDWRTSLLVGNPDLSWNAEYRFAPLPHAQTEVETVQSLIGAAEDRVHFREAATLDRVVGQCRTYGSADVIYLATHAISNRVNPMDGSFVGLAEGNLTGQMLRSDSFEAWAARHPVVVLSACQTALGRVFDGGAYGMSRVAYAAGAAQVVSSLWNVDDLATSQLMSAFADRWYLGYTTEQALQRAMWQVADLYPEDPGAWASFCIFGMPSTRVGA